MFTVLNYSVEVQLPTHGAELWRGNEEGYKQERRISAFGRALCKSFLKEERVAPAREVLLPVGNQI